MARRSPNDSEPKFPRRFLEYDPSLWSCIHDYESERARWLLDAGGAPFGRTASGRPRILPFIQELAGKGPLACDCKRGAEHHD